MTKAILISSCTECPYFDVKRRQSHRYAYICRAQEDQGITPILGTLKQFAKNQNMFDTIPRLCPLTDSEEVNF